MKKTTLFLTLSFWILSINSIAQNFKANINNISMPSINWSLDIELSNFEVQKNFISPQGNARNILALDKKNGLTISVFIEKAEQEGNSIECRNVYWTKAEKSPLAKDNLKKYESSNIAFVEHDTKEYQGKKVDYHSLNAYISHDGYWIDVHISKIGYTENDKSFFDAIINSVKITNPKTRNISEMFLIGSQEYVMRNYKEAIFAYEKILETEKDKINIDEIIWCAVVDNLGMSYGISGDYNNAKRIFEYGIKLKPEYPYFYYNLACNYAEQNDLENALINLELAYSRKENTLPGEKLYNPKEDNSFKKFIKDKKFKDFIKKNGL